jgi:hypothetical protein
MSPSDRIIVPINPSPKDSNPELDYSILQINGALPDKFLPPPIRIREPIEGETLYMIHHPYGQAKRLSSYNCRVVTSQPVENRNVFHWCDSMPGSSGALLFSATDDSVIGLHFASGVGKNIATRFSEIYMQSNIVRSIALKVSQPMNAVKGYAPFTKLDTTTLIEAIDRKNTALVKRHIQFGVNVNNEILGRNPVATAVEANSFDILDLLLINNAIIGKTDKAGKLLHTFVRNSNNGSGDLRILKRLLELGVPVNTPDDNGLTAVCLARRSAVIDIFDRFGVRC